MHDSPFDAFIEDDEVLFLLIVPNCVDYFVLYSLVDYITENFPRQSTFKGHRSIIRTLNGSSGWTSNSPVETRSRMLSLLVCSSGNSSYSSAFSCLHFFETKVTNMS